MGTNTSTEAFKPDSLPKTLPQPKKDIIIGATEIIQEEKTKKYEASKKLMEKYTDPERNERRETGMMRELKKCVLDSENYSCYRSDYILYQPTIDKLRAVGYNVKCIPNENDPFSSTCTICWEKRFWNTTCRIWDGW